MPQESWQQGRTDQEAVLTEDSLSRELPVWPMVAGVVAAAFALDFVSPWLLHPGTFPQFGLLVVAVLLLFTAVMVCGFVVRAIYSRIVPRGQKVITPVVRAACLTALWIPAWVLFVETWSLLMLLAGCLCLASLGIFMKWCTVDAAVPVPSSPPKSSWMPFQFESGAFRRMILPSLLLALLVEASVILIGARWFTTASILCGTCVAILGWRATSKSRLDAGQRIVFSPYRQTAVITAAFVFTVIALLPYLKVSPFTKGLGIFSRTQRASRGVATPKVQAASSDGYIGIILLPLGDEHKKIVVPVKRTLVPNFGVKIAEPMEIPFDGQYWYFKWPEKRPRPTAHVVRGSSTKTQVRSSDRYPLLMEAHQKLAEPLDLGCCSAMDLVVENADQLEGAIGLELWVKKLPNAEAAARQRVNAVAPEQAPHYLGTVAIPSSELPIPERPNASGKLVEEKLRFPIPAAMDGTMFDEITVVVRQAPQRARMGAKVAIKKFVLEP